MPVQHVTRQRNSIALSLGFFVATFLLTRQTQIGALSGLGAPWALFLVVLWLNRSSAVVLIVPVVAYASLSVVGSLFLGHEAINALRFYVIVIGTLLALCVKPVRISAPVALFPLIVQALIVIGVSAWLSVSQDLGLSAAVRTFTLESQWGDVYSHDGIYYRVQLIGNALLPLLFLICLWKYRESRFYRYTMWIALASVVAAGNLTYILVVGLAAILRFWHRMRKYRGVAVVLITVVFCVGIVAGWNNIEEIVDRKFDGADSSMGVRFDQIDSAVRAWSESPTILLVGAGLGTPYPDGKERDYSQYQYIELQLLYLVYQIGVLGMALYLVVLFLLTNRSLTPIGRAIFWLYVLSGCTNPTVLDTNQIVAAMLLVCLFPQSREHRINARFSQHTSYS